MTDLAVPQTSGTALALPSSDSRLSGFGAEDFILPQAHIIQGLPKEKDKYGKMVNTGDVINTLTLERLFAYDPDERKLTGENTFIPLAGFPEWVYWPKGEQRPVYRHRNKHMVPPEDLEWGDEGGKRIPPSATQCFVFICLFAADPSMPLAITFKKTSIKAGQTLLSLEKLRGAKGPGLYAMTFKKASNDDGSWITPVITPKGNPDESLMAIASQFGNLDLGSLKVADEDAENTGTF